MFPSFHVVLLLSFISTGLTTSVLQTECEKLNTSIFLSSTESCLVLDGPGSAGQAEDGCNQLANGRLMAALSGPDMTTVLNTLELKAPKTSSESPAEPSSEETFLLDDGLTAGQALLIKAQLPSSSQEFASIELCESASGDCDLTVLFFTYDFGRLTTFLNASGEQQQNALGGVALNDIVTIEIRRESYGYDVYQDGDVIHQIIDPVTGSEPKPKLIRLSSWQNVEFAKLANISVCIIEKMAKSVYFIDTSMQGLPASATYGSGESIIIEGKVHTDAADVVLPYAVSAHAKQQRITFNLCPETPCNDTILVHISFQFDTDSYYIASYGGSENGSEMVVFTQTSPMITPGQDLKLELRLQDTNAVQIYLADSLFRTIDVSGVQQHEPQYLEHVSGPFALKGSVIIEQLEGAVQTNDGGPSNICARVCLEKSGNNWQWVAKGFGRTKIRYATTLNWDSGMPQTTSETPCACYNLTSKLLQEVSCSPSMPYICEYQGTNKKVSVTKVATDKKGDASALLGVIQGVSGFPMCAESCRRVPVCNAFSHNKDAGLCILYAAKSASMTLQSDTGSDLYDVL